MDLRRAQNKRTTKQTGNGRPGPRCRMGLQAVVPGNYCSTYKKHWHKVGLSLGGSHKETKGHLPLPHSGLSWHKTVHVKMVRTGRSMTHFKMQSAKLQTNLTKERGEGENENIATTQRYVYILKNAVPSLPLPRPKIQPQFWY